MEDFLNNIPELDEVLHEDDMWHALRDLPMCTPREIDTYSISTLVSEGSMDIPRDDDLMDISENAISVRDGEDQDTTSKAEMIDVGDFKNCVVINITDSDARQKAIDFINGLPDDMNVNNITLEVKFDESLVKTESAVMAAEGTDARVEIDTISVTKIPIVGEQIPITSDALIPEGAIAETAEMKVGKKGKKKKKKAVCGHFICGVCGEVYKHAPNLSRHRKQRHKPTSATKCPDCGKVLRRPDYLKGHMKSCAKRY